MKYRNIVVAGDVGTGTTTLAKSLADKLNFKYISRWYILFALLYSSLADGVMPRLKLSMSRFVMFIFHSSLSLCEATIRPLKCYKLFLNPLHAD